MYYIYSSFSMASYSVRTSCTETPFAGPLVRNGAKNLSSSSIRNDDDVLFILVQHSPTHRHLSHPIRCCSMMKFIFSIFHPLVEIEGNKHCRRNRNHDYNDLLMVALGWLVMGFAANFSCESTQGISKITKMVQRTTDLGVT